LCPEGAAVCDYAFHCIVTDVSGGQLSEMNDLVHEGVTSFKLFMAYPGVFMLDDGSIFKALQTTARNAGWFACTPKTAARLTSSCSSSGGRQAGAEVSRAYSSHTAEAEAVGRAMRWQRWRARPSTSST